MMYPEQLRQIEVAITHAGVSFAAQEKLMEAIAALVEKAYRDGCDEGYDEGFEYGAGVTREKLLEAVRSAK